MKLYELSAEFRQIADVLEQLDDKTHEEAILILQAELDALHAAIETKLEGCAAMVRTWTVEVAAYFNESVRMANRAATIRARVDWLKAYMQRCMEEAELTKCQAGLFRISIVKNGGYAPLQVNVDSLSPSLYRLIKEPDMATIREMVLSGDIPVGVVVGPRGTHLRIT